MSRLASPCLACCACVVAAVEEVDDGDGDYVPRATTMRLRGSSPPPPSRRAAQSARLRTRSSITGDELPDEQDGQAAERGAAEAPDLSKDGAGAEGSAKRRKAEPLPGARTPASLEQRESRSGSPTEGQAPAEETSHPWVPSPHAQHPSPSPPPPAADAPGASSVAGLMHPERSVLDRVKVPKNQRSARAPRAAAPSLAARDAARGSPALPSSNDTQQARSPVKQEAAAEREERQAPVSAARPVLDAIPGSPSSGASAASAPVETPATITAVTAAPVPASRTVATAAAGAPAAEAKRPRDAHPASPRNQRPTAPEGKAAVAAGREEKSAGGPQSPRIGASHHAKASVKSPKPRPADGAPGKGAPLRKVQRHCCCYSRLLSGHIISIKLCTWVSDSEGSAVLGWDIGCDLCVSWHSP